MLALKMLKTEFTGFYWGGGGGGRVVCFFRVCFILLLFLKLFNFYRNLHGHLTECVVFAFKLQISRLNEHIITQTSPYKSFPRFPPNI